jgi:hypothetical protein
MKAPRITDGQLAALAALADSKLTAVGMMLYCGPQWRRTTESLISRGLVKYQPYAALREGAYAITRDGLKAMRANGYHV